MDTPSLILIAYLLLMLAMYCLGVFFCSRIIWRTFFADSITRRRATRRKKSKARLRVSDEALKALGQAADDSAADPRFASLGGGDQRDERNEGNGRDEGDYRQEATAALEELAEGWSVEARAKRWCPRCRRGDEIPPEASFCPRCGFCLSEGRVMISAWVGHIR